MAVNAVMQKHSSLPGTPMSINVNQPNQQPILISRASDGSLTPTVTSHNPGYITVGGNHQVGSSGLQTLIASGGQVIQGAPLTLSQLQSTDLSQTAGKPNIYDFLDHFMYMYMYIYYVVNDKILVIIIIPFVLR